VEVEHVPPARGELLQRTVAALGRRHVGAVAGILELADGQPLISVPAVCERPMARLRTPTPRSRSARSPRRSQHWHSPTPWSPGGCHSTPQFATSRRRAHQSPVRDAVEITVEHLARHTSGLPRSPQRLGLRAVWAAGARGEDPYAPITTPVLLEQPAAVDDLRSQPSRG